MLMLELPVLWPPDAKSQLTGKDPDAGKDWRQEKGTTEDEMVGCHHQLNSQESEQTLGDCEGQGSLACCSPWGRKESDWTTELKTSDGGTLRPPSDVYVKSFVPFCTLIKVCLSDLEWSSLVPGPELNLQRSQIQHRSLWAIYQWTECNFHLGWGGG